MARFETIIGYLSLFIPPCLLLPLFFIPPDIVTSIYWLVGGVAATISLLSLTGKAITFFLTGKVSKLTFIRPGLTVIIFAACIVSIKFSTINAREHAKSTAEYILEKYQGDYPKAMDEWEQSSYTSYRMVGWPAKYNMSYHRDETLNNFIIRLRMNIDSSYTYTIEQGKVIEVYNCC